MSYIKMPIVLEVPTLTQFAKTCLSQITKRDGTLYASRPKNASGSAQYVWRMVAFSLSSNPVHQCMPVLADFYVTDADLPTEFRQKVEDDPIYRAAYEKKRAWYYSSEATFYRSEAERDQAFIRSVESDKRRLWLKHLDTIAKEITDTIPVRNQPGTMRWGRALGMCA
jgi:hypothetical protein